MPLPVPTTPVTDMTLVQLRTRAKELLQEVEVPMSVATADGYLPNWVDAQIKLALIYATLGNAPTAP